MMRIAISPRLAINSEAITALVPTAAASTDSPRPLPLPPPARGGGTLVNRVAYACQQFHGGMGYLRESAIERMVRDARVQAIGGGATEVMLEEVAKRLPA
ncbi:MAG: acyl-CoA dehydrogenase family protein [Acetobacteraceae bacterium]